MNWYLDNGIEWEQIIKTVASEMHRDKLMIEKDTIQSMFLYELSKSSIPFVFKGGTSLSKVYHVIDRFSEDIDLSMSRKPTESEKRSIKQLILEIAERLGMVLTNPESIRSRYDYNKYVFCYNSLYFDTPMTIIIETSFYQPVYPVEQRKVDSFVGQFCTVNNIKLPITFDASTVIMNVQSLQRTFVDKVFAICDYRIQNKQDRDSRHLYDICKLFKYINFNAELKDLVCRVRKDRMRSKNNPSAQEQYDIPKMLKEIITSHFFEDDYKEITQALLYEDVSYEYAIENGIKLVAELDIFEYVPMGTSTVQKIIF